MILTAIERARSVLRANKYFALATIDENGPWVAVLAYTIGKDNRLYFFSEKTSRHGQAILNGGAIAGVIYNSQCTADDAESLQFSGTGYLSHDKASLKEVMQNQAEIEIALQNSSTLLFAVKIEQAFVLDQKLYKEQGIDAREIVPASELI